MDIMPLVLGSIFLLVLFVGNIFLVFYIGYKARIGYGETTGKIQQLDEKVQILTDAYTTGVKDILHNQTELINILRSDK